MTKALVVYNNSCLKCDSIYSVMVKIGPMVFCNDCFTAEFIDTGRCTEEDFEIDPKCDDYKAWLEFYKRHVGTTLEK